MIPDASKIPWPRFWRLLQRRKLPKSKALKLPVRVKCVRLALISKRETLTSSWARLVLSCPGKCSSIARTTQLAMIVTMTPYSKTGHSMIHLTCLLIGLSSVRMKRDDGPCSPGVLFPFGILLDAFQRPLFTTWRVNFSVSWSQDPNHECCAASEIHKVHLVYHETSKSSKFFSNHVLPSAWINATIFRSKDGK